jgi:antitoxin YefM
MHTIYRLNASELDQHFINALKATFQNKEIEIVVYEVDETAYLMASEANREKLISAIENVKSGSQLIEVDIENIE